MSFENKGAIYSQTGTYFVRYKTYTHIVKQKNYDLDQALRVECVYERQYKTGFALLCNISLEIHV